MATLDDLIHEVGSCGRFQVALVVAIHLTIICTVWGMMFMAFGGFDPGWTCLNETSGLMDGIIENKTSDWPAAPVHPLTNQSTDQCDVFATCHNVSFNTYASTVVSEWALVCELQWVPSFMFTIQSVGMMVGAYVAGHLGDCLGRKTSTYAMLLMHAISNLAAIFSTNWQVFTAFRFVIGATVGGILSTVITIPIEFLGPFGRVVSCSLPTWSIGVTLWAVSVLVLRDWRWVHLTGAVLSLCSFSLAFWVPESMRWLAVHGKDRHASAVAGKIARINKRPPPSTELLANVADTERRLAQGHYGKGYSYIDLLFRGGKRIQKYAICMAIVWFSMSLMYFAITFAVKDLHGDFYINNLIFSAAELPALLFVAPALRFLGRRWGTAAHFLVGTAVCLAIVPVSYFLGSDGDSAVDSKDILRGRLVMGLALVGKMMVIGAWHATLVFTGELFPTVVRSLAFGFINGASRLGAILGPQVLPNRPDNIPHVLAGMSGLMLLCTGLILALPETKGKALEDTLQCMEPAEIKLTKSNSKSEGKRDVTLLEDGDKLDI